MRDDVASRGNGFTLVEVLVALAIFSLAALALLRLEGAALGTTARLDEKTIAAIVARNRAIDVMLAVQPPAFGQTNGTANDAGRNWRWTQIVARTPDARIARIDIRVTGNDGDTAASLTFVRRVA